MLVIIRHNHDLYVLKKILGILKILIAENLKLLWDNILNILWLNDLIGFYEKEVSWDILNKLTGFL